MPTVAKARQPARLAASKKERAVAGIGPRRTPPPARRRASALLAMGDGFGKGADWEVIARAHEARDL